VLALQVWLKELTGQHSSSSFNSFLRKVLEKERGSRREILWLQERERERERAFERAQ
jgi:hypothetical protein